MTVTAITTSVASSTSYMDFTIDDTYDEILFTFTGMKYSVDEKNLSFQVVTTNGSHNRPVQSATYREWHYVFDYSAGIGYDTSRDNKIADANFVTLHDGGDTHNSYSATSGHLRIFNPHDDTKWKFFEGQSVTLDGHIHAFQRYTINFKVAGYIKDSADITSIRFQSTNYLGDTTGAGNLTYGTITHYGIS